MAVYCGVCARQLSSAPDNGGSFRTSDFGGWDTHNSRSRIADTCEDCADVLKDAVAKAARVIARKNARRVEALRKTLAEQGQSRYAHEQEKIAFEKAWRERPR